LWDGTRVTVHSTPLSVQHSVGEPIPEVRQPPEEGSERPSSVRGQDTGHVFPDDPPRPEAINQSEIHEREVSAGVVEPLSEAGDGEALTGCSTHENVNCTLFDVPLTIALHRSKI